MRNNLMPRASIPSMSSNYLFSRKHGKEASGRYEETMKQARGKTEPLVSNPLAMAGGSRESVS
jgi:hypothetical protein